MPSPVDEEDDLFLGNRGHLGKQEGIPCSTSVDVEVALHDPHVFAAAQLYMSQWSMCLHGAKEQAARGQKQAVHPE